MSEAPRPARRLCKFSYALGVFSALVLLTPPLLRAGHKLGFANLLADARDVLCFWRSKESRVLDIPPEFVAELTRYLPKLIRE